jgi:hypothetical protein
MYNQKGRIVLNDELERIWKEVAVNYFITICLKELMKTMENLRIASLHTEI